MSERVVYETARLCFSFLLFTIFGQFNDMFFYVFKYLTKKRLEHEHFLRSMYLNQAYFLTIMYCLHLYLLGIDVYKLLIVKRYN